MEKNDFPLVYLLCVVVLFVGLVLSFTVMYLTDAFLADDAAACYDGTVIAGTGPDARLTRAVYQKSDALARVNQYEYRLFGIVKHPNVIAGKHDFLFEVYDEEHDYNYLDDYLGNVAFDEEECAAILAYLEAQRELYRARGADYLLVVVPNAQTVYDDYLPAPLGNISAQTRLTRLNAYLKEHEYYSYADLTPVLRAYRSGEPLYNNTENSVNALGLFYVYRAVHQYFSDSVTAVASPLTLDELEFYRHYTDGLGIAREAGLSDTVRNLTISLSGDTSHSYSYSFTRGNATRTVRPGRLDNPPVLLCFTHNRERMQSEPFFSNTFNKVTYQLGFADDPSLFEESPPRAVIHVIYENELSLLLQSGAP